MSLCNSCIHGGICVVRVRLSEAENFEFPDGQRAIVDLESALVSCDHYTPESSRQPVVDETPSVGRSNVYDHPVVYQEAQEPKVAPEAPDDVSAEDLLREERGVLPSDENEALAIIQEIEQSGSSARPRRKIRLNLKNL